MRLPDFDKLFEDGRRAGSVFGPVTLRVQDVGNLWLTTGRIVACDPAVAEGVEAYTVTVPLGSYPAALAVAHFEDGDQRVAAAMLRLSYEKAVSWEMALLPGEDAAELAEGEVFGFSVDSGTACLMDEEAARALVERARREEDFFGLIADEMEKTYVDTWSWANFVLDPSKALKIITFSAGFGDGLYASYFGRDAQGEVCRLVTDFALFDFDQLA